MNSLIASNILEMMSKLYINILTILFSFFLYTGFYFQQQDLEDAISRTANSACGALILVFMVAFLVKNIMHIRMTYTVVCRYILLWMLLIITQTYLTCDSMGRFLVNMYYVTLWPVSFMTFYVLSSNKKYNEGIVVNRFVFLFLLSAALYYITATESYITTGYNGSVGNSYYILCFMPWVLLVPAKKWRNFLLFVLALIVLVSAKRTSIMAVIVGLTFFFISNTRKISFVSRVVLVCILAAVTFYAYQYVDQIFLDGHVSSRFNNFENGAEKRYNIHETVLYMFQHSSSSDKFIGHGYNKVIMDSPLYLSAHSDFLETLYDHGIVMFALQLLIIVRMLYLSYKLRNTRSPQYPPYLASIFIYVVMAYTSHLILYPYYFCYISGFWGFVEGNYVANLRESIRTDN